MSREPDPRFDFEVVPMDAEEFSAPTPMTAAKAALEGALARWSTEFVACYSLDHPDLATPAQAVQELRVADQIRQLFWALSPAEKTDPDVLARIRAQVAALISHELGLDPPISLRESPEERSLRWW
jgi:hypothetical protein